MTVGRGPKAGQIHKDTRPLVKAALKAGWTWGGATKKSHWKLHSPDGRKTVSVACSPSDHRNLLNLRADLRRAGLNV